MNIEKDRKYFRLRNYQSSWYFNHKKYRMLPTVDWDVKSKKNAGIHVEASKNL